MGQTLVARRGKTHARTETKKQNTSKLSTQPDQRLYYSSLESKLGECARTFARARSCVISWNATGIMSSSSYLCNTLNLKSIDICGISEHWL